MHNPDSILEDETHKSLWGFEIQMDNLFSASQTGLVIVNKKQRTCKIVDSANPGDERVKPKESKKRDEYHDLHWKRKKN